MAKTKSASEKPAATKPATAKKEFVGVTLKDVATKLNTDPKSLRARIRRIKGGAQVGKGGRYAWKSFNDPSLKKLMAELSK
jgi:hypothetical protein